VKKRTVLLIQLLIPFLFVCIVAISLSNCGSSGGTCTANPDVDLTQSECLAETINMACGTWHCSFFDNVTLSRQACTPNGCTILNCGSPVFKQLVATSTTGFVGEEVFSDGSTTLFACDLTLPVPTPPSAPLPTPQ
jgi:hypothetical protein